jgi:hypothetical protein
MYLVAALAEYLVLHGEMLSPKLLLKVSILFLLDVILCPDSSKIKGGSDLAVSKLDVNGVEMQAGMWRDLVSQGRISH